MADHHHVDRTSYFAEQISMIGICGALGGVAIMMWQRGTLHLILDAKFHLPVLFGGAALLIMVAIRAAALWRADECAACTHGHHDAPRQDHAWSPWRYGVLLLPIVLCFLNLPNRGFSSQVLKAGDVNIGQVIDQLQVAPTVNVSAEPEPTREPVLILRFQELEEARFDALQRDWYTGRKGKVRGQFAPSERDRFFTLVRWRRTCCTTDARRLNVVIEAPESLSKFQIEEWVEVEGSIKFLYNPVQKTYLPYIKVSSMDKIQRVPPDPDFFLQ